MTARAHDQIEELHAVPPAEFTRARDALAAAFRKSGDAASAAKVRQLRKPSVVVWAVNRLARDAPEAVGRFVDAVERLRRAQLGRSAELPEATAAQRRALHELQRRVSGVLAEGSVRSSAALERRISGTLLGAATDRRVRADLLHGRLTAELPPPGLDALLGGGTLRLVPKPAEPPRKPASAKRERAAKALLPRHEDTAGARRAGRSAEREARRASTITHREARAALRSAEREAQMRGREAIRLERAAAAQRRAAEAAERSARELRDRVSSAEAEWAARREFAAAHPGLAKDVHEAFLRSRDLCLSELDEAATAAARAREDAERAVEAAAAAKRRAGPQ
jgi:hypothetical protein